MPNEKDTYYVLSSSSVVELEAQVRRCIAAGYHPAGGVGLTEMIDPKDYSTPYRVYYQAVWRAPTRREVSPTVA